MLLQTGKYMDGIGNIAPNMRGETATAQDMLGFSNDTQIFSAYSQ